MEVTAYYLTSDIHIGDGSKRDDFTDVHAARLLRELETIKANGGKAVLLGDIFDVWRYGFKPIQKRRSGLIDVLNSMQPLYIIGNHEGDDFLSHRDCFKGCELCYRTVLTTGAGEFFLAHGHEFDLLNGWFKSIGRTATTVASKLGRLSPKLEDFLGTIGGKLTGAGRHTKHDEFTEAALDWLCGFYGVDGMFLGHTHRWVNKTETNKTGDAHRYYNLGTWAENGWVKIDERVVPDALGV